MNYWGAVLRDAHSTWEEDGTRYAVWVGKSQAFNADRFKGVALEHA